jgi:hypothetical protein
MLYPLSYGGGAGAIRGRKPRRRTNEATGIGRFDRPVAPTGVRGTAAPSSFLVAAS